MYNMIQCCIIVFVLRSGIVQMPNSVKENQFRSRFINGSIQVFRFSTLHCYVSLSMNNKPRDIQTGSRFKNIKPVRLTLKDLPFVNNEDEVRKYLASRVRHIIAETDLVHNFYYRSGKLTHEIAYEISRKVSNFYEMPIEFRKSNADENL